MNRAQRARRRELDCAFTSAAEVGIEPPAETLIELLRAVDIRHGDGDHLKLQVDLPDPRVRGRFLHMGCGGAHGCLLLWVGVQEDRDATCGQRAGSIAYSQRHIVAAPCMVLAVPGSPAGTVFYYAVTSS